MLRAFLDYTNAPGKFGGGNYSPATCPCVERMSLRAPTCMLLHTFSFILQHLKHEAAVVLERYGWIPMHRPPEPGPFSPPPCVPMAPLLRPRHLHAQRSHWGGRHPPKSSQEFPAQYIEQDAKQGPSSQFAERAGSGLKALFQQQRAAWAECTCAGARMSIHILFSVEGGSSVLPPSRSATRRSEFLLNEV